MTTFLPKDIQANLDAARIKRLAKQARLHVEVGGKRHPVLRQWKTGFAIAAEDAPILRGFVDLYENGTHLFQCLIVASEDGDHGERVFEFKRATAVSGTQPLDHARAPDAPVALIGVRR